MDTNTKIIIGMTVATTLSAVAQGILSSQGRIVESGYIDLATKSGLACTALTIFAKAITMFNKL